MLEADFQKGLKKKIYEMLPGAIVLKNDPNDIPGIPDLTIFYKERYAVLEVKRSKDAAYRPNQEWYLKELGKYIFTATVYPENEEEVLHELQRALQPS